MSGEQGGNGRRPIFISVAILAYQQVGAALGALSLLALSSHFFEIKWQQMFAQAIGVWDIVVRPVFKWILNDVAGRAIEVLTGNHFEFQLVWRDYISVGTIMFMSIMRARTTYLKTPSL